MSHNLTLWKCTSKIKCYENSLFLFVYLKCNLKYIIDISVENYQLKVDSTCNQSSLPSGRLHVIKSQLEEKCKIQGATLSLEM